MALNLTPPKIGWKVRTRDSDNLILSMVVKGVETRQRAVRVAVERHKRIARRREHDGGTVNVYLLWVNKVTIPNWTTHPINYKMIERPERISSEKKNVVLDDDGLQLWPPMQLAEQSNGRCYDSKCSGSPCNDGLPDPKYQCPWYDLKGKGD